MYDDLKQALATAEKNPSDKIALNKAREEMEDFNAYNARG